MNTAGDDKRDEQAAAAPLRVMISAGASGLGLGMAQAFVGQGAHVQLCDISQTAIDAALPQLGERAGAMLADVSDPAAVDAWFEHALRALGGVDVLINNAGIAGPTARIEDIASEAWDQTMAVNVRSQYLCVRRAIGALRASDRATIINMSSVAGRLGYPLRTPYAASKWAVVGLTQSLALELGEDNITVNAILPGIVDSERSRVVTQAKAQARGVTVAEMEASILANVALHRKVPVDDVAATALFLASPAGRSFTGQSFNVCAGIQTLL
ncbi:SDR family oxidoreductase [Pigmentiphaga aceris]|uniref:SDR family oxidoreductase n=1 Tax=Pigmentiphaga aceris TaxID=1940612 RepID=A0A5C0B1A1_9BURK|nr:SDR family oxidoreductase [Pigmentiphaga aceris]QEI07533.1 SDR family oxidoreductase [Pigmentiphaga aceris]